MSMGNTESSTVTGNFEAKTHPSSLPPIPAVPESQTNNNGTDEDEWQTNLDDWRERRRKVSLMRTNQSCDERLKEDEEKKKAAARDRLRSIRAQRSLTGSSDIPPLDTFRPVPPSSPGIALLTGRGHEFLDLYDDTDANLKSSVPQSFNEPSPHTPKSDSSASAMDNTCTTLSVTKCEPMQSPRSLVAAAVPSGPHDVEPKHHPDNAVVNGHIKAETVNIQSKVTNSDRNDLCFAPHEFREVHIRLQNKARCTETRWGMVIDAKGRSGTSPFVVDRVKIGSSADVCDIAQGDILVRINGTDLRQRSSSKSDDITLREVEDLLDRLSFNNQVINLHVLRKRSLLDDQSDDDIEESVAVSAPIGVSKPTQIQDTSDVDEQVYEGAALIVNRNGVRGQSAGNSKSAVVRPIKDSNGFNAVPFQKPFEFEDLKTQRTDSVNHLPDSVCTVGDTSNEDAHHQMEQSSLEIAVRNSVVTHT